EYVRAGRLRPLAVTGTTRSKLLPDIPTVADFVPGYEASAWYGIGAPKNTPTEIISKLNATINANLPDPVVKERFDSMGAPLLTGWAGEFGKYVAEETEKWAKVVKFSGAKPD